MDAATSTPRACAHGDQAPRCFAPPEAHAEPTQEPGGKACMQEVRLRVPPFYVLQVPPNALFSGDLN